MKKFDRFQDAAEVKIEFDSVSDRRLYLKANNKYSVTVSFDQVLNNKCTVKYSRFNFDCSCGHSAMRAMPNQMQNHCKHVLAVIAWLVNNKGRWEK